MKANKNIIFAVVVSAVAIFALSVVVFLPSKSKEVVDSSSTKTIKTESKSISTPGNLNANGDLVINVSDISDKVTFYSYDASGVKLEVMAVKAPDGTIRTAFNTCQVCYSSGKGYYVQKGSNLVCQNCGNRFAMSDIQVSKGGCNPVPIFKEDKVATDSTITISKDFINKSKDIFKKWKS